MRAQHNTWATGLERRRLYSLWCGIHARCTDTTRSDYARYGAKGVTVCERWELFSNFLEDMGPRPSAKHSVDRKDGKRGYEPDNCRWATVIEQQRNRSNNHMITWRGETRCMTEWGEVVGLSRDVLKDRLRKGWSVDRALGTPLMRTTGSAS